MEISKENEIHYTREQLIEGDRYTYELVGSSPCESCKYAKNRKQYFLSECCHCEEYEEYIKVYGKYFDEYIEKTKDNGI